MIRVHARRCESVKLKLHYTVPGASAVLVVRCITGVYDCPNHWVSVAELAPLCEASMCGCAPADRHDHAIRAVDLVSSLDLLTKPCLVSPVNCQLPGW
jgi:hypothetical protein